MDVTLLQQGGSAEEPAADENRFELVLKKLKGIAVGSFGILQIPISLKALSQEESSGEVQVVMDGAAVTGHTLTQPLLWQYPIKVMGISHLEFEARTLLTQTAGCTSTLHTLRGTVNLAVCGLSQSTCNAKGRTEHAEALSDSPNAECATRPNVLYHTSFHSTQDIAPTALLDEESATLNMNVMSAVLL